jgi:hypothetical protein
MLISESPNASTRGSFAPVPISILASAKIQRDPQRQLGLASIPFCSHKVSYPKLGPGNNADQQALDSVSALTDSL